MITPTWSRLTHFVKRLSLRIVAPFAALQDALAMASINVVLFVSGFDEIPAEQERLYYRKD
jgi:hypothetical protein